MTASTEKIAKDVRELINITFAKIRANTDKDDLEFMSDYLTQARTSIVSDAKRQTNISLSKKILNSVVSNVRNVTRIRELDCIDTLTELLTFDEKQNNYAAILLSDSKSNKMLKATAKALMNTNDSVSKKVIIEAIENAHVSNSTATRQSLMTINSMRALKAINADTSKHKDSCIVSRAINFESVMQSALKF